jgi:hypothetical protein
VSRSADSEWIFGWGVKPEPRLHGPFQRNHWNHVVVTRRGDTYTMWTNGVKVGSERSSADISDTGNTNPFLVGGGTTDRGAQSMFEGALDEFRVFHRCLSDAEIAALYNNGGAGLDGGVSRSPADSGLAEAAKNAADAAQTPESAADKARKRLLELNAAIRAAQQARDEAVKARKTIEDEIIDAQSPVSDFGKVRDRCRAADKAYQAAQKAVKDTDEFKPKLEAVRAADDDNRAQALLALSDEFYAMPEIAAARSTFQDARAAYDPLRDKLLGADPKWVEADKDLKDKEKAVADLNRQFSDAYNAVRRPPRYPRKYSEAD